MRLLLPDAKQNYAAYPQFTAISSRMRETETFGDKLRQGAPAKIAWLACPEICTIANKPRHYEIV
jgi:hypothetical protein